ncbi:hypothetical protein [Lacipirellula limnantheis]|uniref:Uncharacterized protein n=1 Tax=Lacipirellula limnantheis TaxID=2528024 RepID=A0A517U1J0_9BACT|nr:hypothetical protein [Lacipirellula limnantheis]QDT74480.1 hypothetical protein I41_36770 [Lacipirellula limnantheis]
MGKLIRYALATFCFVASFGWLALWGWSVSDKSRDFMVSYNSEGGAYHGQLFNGQLHAYFAPKLMMWDEYVVGWFADSRPSPEGIVDRRLEWPLFGPDNRGGYFFPAWYASLIFALAGVGVIRFRRQFSIRSALIVFAVVAALLAMPLTL